MRQPLHTSAVANERRIDIMCHRRDTLSHIMQFFLDKIKLLNIGWNERPLTEADFYRLCRRFKVTAEELPLRVSGFYYCVKGGHYIAIDSKLPPPQKLLVMFHEFAHFWLHAPDTGVTANFHGVGRRTRKEAEADIFALCSLVPRKWLESRSPAEIIDEDGISPELMRERQRIFETFGL